MKLELLQRYLGAWFSIIARRFPEAIYFDAFAGPGEYSTGEDGSPIIALKQASNVCADQSAFRPILVYPAALENLNAVVNRTQKHEHIQLFIESGGFEKAHQRISELRRTRPRCPIFSFVDPFGIKDIPLSTILDLLGFESSECFINLMSGWSNRFIDHPDEKVTTHVQNLLGGNFTGEVLASKNRIETIISIYRRQLSLRAKYVRSFKLYDEGNVLDNALIFAGNNVLTKRPERTAALNGQLSWPDHIWMGTSVENNDYVERIDCLRQTSAAVKFLSLEPLLGPLDDLDLTGIDWVIVGGESGPGARRMDSAWVRSIRDQCVEQNVALHFEQWGGSNKKKTGRVLDGRTWDQLPRRKDTSQPSTQPAFL